MRRQTSDETPSIDEDENEEKDEDDDDEDEESDLEQVGNVLNSSSKGCQNKTYYSYSNYN
jgi:hypothetical protein